MELRDEETLILSTFALPHLKPKVMHLILLGHCDEQFAILGTVAVPVVFYCK